jgi:hypothetical protein
MHVFQPFRAIYAERLLKLKKKFLVTQTYQLPETLQHDKVALLISDYEQLSRAKTHLNAIKANDRYAAIIHLENESHRQKLMAMLSPGSSYSVFFAVIKSAAELENHLNMHYKEKMRKWIDQNTTWRITGSGAIRPSLQLVFGIIYINLKHAGQSIRIKFDDLESV